MAINDYLQEKEEIRYTSRGSKSAAILPLFLGLLLVTAGAVLFFMSVSEGASSITVTYAKAGLLIFGFFVLAYAIKVFTYGATTKIYITDKRIILKKGFFTSNFSEIPVDNISGINIHEPFLGRIFHYGRINIESNATSVGIRAANIKKPFDFKKFVEGKA